MPAESVKDALTQLGMAEASVTEMPDSVKEQEHERTLTPAVLVKELTIKDITKLHCRS